MVHSREAHSETQETRKNLQKMLAKSQKEQKKSSGARVVLCFVPTLLETYEETAQRS